MIDDVYKTLNIIVNKDNNGYLSPREFNQLANTVQLEIFRSYFEDENRDKNKENRGLTNRGYSNLSFNQRQLINPFEKEETLSISNGVYPLPTDLYLIQDDGVYHELLTNPTVIDEVEKYKINYLLNSIAKPSQYYPVFESFSVGIKVYPTTIQQDIKMKYIRVPKAPKWTFVQTIDGDPLFNPAAGDFQDFELSRAEFHNIVINMASYFGINLRELDVTQIVEAMRNKNDIKNNE